MVTFTLITNRERGVEIALEAGIRQIAIDLEGITKLQRQAGCGLFIAGHSIEDLARMRSRFSTAEILVRVNSINPGSAEELKRVSGWAPQRIMLPFFTSLGEVDAFLALVPKGASPVLLLESVMSLRLLDRLLESYPVREYFIGLNDLSLDLGNRNFLVTLEDPLFQESAERLAESGLDWGMGGVGNPFDDTLPISPRRFFEYQIAMGCDRALFSRNFRILFDLPDPMDAVRTALRELDRLIAITNSLSAVERHRLCRQFMDDHAKHRSLNLYPPKKSPSEARLPGIAQAKHLPL